MARKKGPLRNSANAHAREAGVLKQAEALRLRLAGATYDQIAAQMGYTAGSTVYTLIKRALIATLQEPADEVRALELERLDRLMLSLWQQATTTGPFQLASIDRVLRIMAQRCWYVTGLKVPDRVAEVRPDGTSVYDASVASAEFQQLMGALTARYQGEPGAEPVAEDPDASPIRAGRIRYIEE